jgi:tripartite-type tricarboxylate transporter receptor subunit TctC
MDIAARIIGQGLQKTYGRTVLVKNMPGANGTIAANDLFSIATDPSEIMIGSLAMFAVAPLFNKGVSLKLEDYKVISGLTAGEWFFCVNTEKSGIKNWAQFVEHAKNNRILFTSRAPGGAGHMIATGLFGEAGIKAEAITTDGINKDILALISGDVVCTFLTETVVKQYIDSITPLLVFHDTDAPYTKFEGHAVPSAKSLGYNIVYGSNNFILTRAEADQAGVDSLHQAILEYSKTTEFIELAEKADLTLDIATDGATIKKTIENVTEACKLIYDKYYRR